MIYTSTVTRQLSDGVAVALHKPTTSRRALLTSMTVETLERLRLLTAEAQGLEATNPALHTTLAKLQTAMTAVNTALILCFFAGSSGLVLDGNATPTPAEFSVNAPDHLRAECISAIELLLKAKADAPLNAIFVN